MHVFLHFVYTQHIFFLNIIKGPVINQGSNWKRFLYVSLSQYDPILDSPKNVSDLQTVYLWHKFVFIWS